MKKQIIFTLVSLFFLGSITAQNVPQPSPYAEVMQTVGLTDITIAYSRPGVKDRKIFGDLEAYGEVWRTGANAATKITFSADVKIQGQDIPAGTYSIFTVPGESDWKVMLNSDVNASEGSYTEEKNVGVFEVKGMETEMVETMEFSFQNVTADNADIVFKWENTKWELQVEVNSKDAAIANIKQKINEIENAYGVYNSSARYYLNAGLDLDQALAWSKKSVEISAKFWNVYTLSLIYEAKGDKKNAIATAKQSLKLAEEANYQPYVKMNKENIAKWSAK